MRTVFLYFNEMFEFGYKFIVDEVIPRRNTAQWIDLEESRSLFPTDLHPQDRLIYCLNRIVENHFLIFIDVLSIEFSLFIFIIIPDFKLE